VLLRRGIGVRETRGIRVPRADELGAGFVPHVGHSAAAATGCRAVCCR
jgi:hypothetical protein